MRRKEKVAPAWAADFIANWPTPNERELHARKGAVKRALALREALKIAPLTTGKLVSSIRAQA